MDKKIFVIEDDSSILYGLESQLSSEGFEVETSTGDEDLEELMTNLRDFAADYVILDLILPKVDGFDIIKRIKEDEELGAVPIFIFTDLSDEDNKIRSLELGADYYFIKDEFDTYEFVEKVVKIINNKEKASEDDDDESEGLDFID